MKVGPTGIVLYSETLSNEFYLQMTRQFSKQQRRISKRDTKKEHHILAFRNNCFGKLLLQFGTRAYLYSPDEGSCYIFSSRKDFCVFLLSYGIIRQSDIQPHNNIHLLIYPGNRGGKRTF